MHEKRFWRYTLTGGKAMAGRKIKLTEEIIHRFVTAIKLGCPIKDACGCAGIAESTYYRWMELADTTRKDAHRFSEFRERVKIAEGEATQNWLAIIEKAARDGSWQAAAWKLERRRGMFIPKVRTEVTGKDGEAIKVESAANSARDIIEAAIARHAPAEGVGEGSGETDPRTTH